MKVDAVILAAGESRRLGRAKQLLVYGGQTLLERAVEAARGAAVARAIVVLGAVRVDLGPNVVTVMNDAWQGGMASSIRAGMAVVAPDADAVLLMVCDQPLLGSAHLAKLMVRGRAEGTLVASGYDGIAGVPALFPRRCFAALRALEGTQGARSILSADPGPRAVVPFPEGSADIDTMEDYEQLLTQH